mmetsp:Transcript_3961/g.7376  ORF Transcript_3961/g.7376 Transcript_3961/m.7376 type:complete len:288 (+) Transcript_3961:250-1113(+)
MLYKSNQRYRSRLRKASIIMASSTNQAALTSGGRVRDRSYSDAHAFILNKTTNSSSHNSSDVALDNTDTEDATHKSNTMSNLKMANTKKHNSHHHQHQLLIHHNHGNRPRSKSCDLHRHHSTPVHKKKIYPHHHPKRTQSPGAAGNQRANVGGRISPANSPKLKGKMWIRPAAAIPFIPVLAGAAPTSTKEQQNQQQVNDLKEFIHLSSLDASLPPPVRQVTNGSSPSPTSFDDEMMLYAAPDAPFNPSSQLKGGPASPTRVIFGESGKIIMPRSAFEQYIPTTPAE